MSCYKTSNNTVSCYKTSTHTMSCYKTSTYTVSCYKTSTHTVSCYKKHRLTQRPAAKNGDSYSVLLQKNVDSHRGVLHNFESSAFCHKKSTYTVPGPPHIIDYKKLGVISVNCTVSTRLYSVECMYSVTRVLECAVTGPHTWLDLILTRTYSCNIVPYICFFALCTLDYTYFTCSVLFVLRVSANYYKYYCFFIL